MTLRRRQQQRERVRKVSGRALVLPWCGTLPPHVGQGGGKKEEGGWRREEGGGSRGDGRRRRLGQGRGRVRDFSIALT
jgi:hypothetical protein